jgi:hypothetical protein
MQESNFLTGLGSTYACNNCAGPTNNYAQYIPISKSLLYSDKKSHSEVIGMAEQDIIVLTTQCFQTVPTTVVPNHVLRFNVTNLTAGPKSTTLMVRITSREDYTGELREMTCTMFAYDRKGIASVRYSLSDTGNAARIKVDEITAPSHSNCTNTLGYCLDLADREFLSYSLLQSILPVGVIDIDQDYSLSSGILSLKVGFFPDPGSGLTDKEFSSFARASFANTLLVATQHFIEPVKESIDLYSDHIAVKLKVDKTLQQFCVGICALVVFYSLGLLFVDIVQLGRKNNILVRRLEHAVKPGRISAEYFCKYAYNQLEFKNTVWDEEAIKFGEDRHTIQETEGRLMFGAKKDVIKFKRTRNYI